jgi:uncharacterized protein YfbU (UPF0304 family)
VHREHGRYPPIGEFVDDRECQLVIDVVEMGDVWAVSVKQL